MERQSTSKLFKVVIAVVAFFLLCTSAVLFASCGTSREECEHEWDPTPILTAEATCGTPGFVVYECKICGEECKLEYSLATGQHTFNENNVCTTCGMTQSQADLLNTATFNAALTEVKEALSKLATEDSVKKLNNLSEAQVKTLVEAAQKALNGDITSAKQAVLDALNGENGLSASLSKAVTDAKTALNSKITEALTALTALDTKTASKEEITKAVADAQEAIKGAITEAQNTLGTKVDALTQESSPLMLQLAAIMNEFKNTDGNAFAQILQALSQLSNTLGDLGGTVDGIDGTLGTLNGKISADLSSNVEAIKKYIDDTLKAAIGDIQTDAGNLSDQLLNGTTGIFAQLKAAQEAINAKVAEYGNKQLTAEQVKQAVSDLLNGQGGAEGGLSKTLTDAVNSAKEELAGKIDKVLTSQKFETAMSTVNTKLDDITTAVTDTLSQQITQVETNLTDLLDGLNAAITAEDGTLPTIKGWIDDLKKAILGDEAAAMSDASAGSLPNGMKAQIENIWKIVDAMEKTLNGVATKGEYDQKFEELNKYLQQQVANLQGEHTALDEAINGKAGAEGKKTGGLVQSLAALSETLGTIDSKINEMDGKLDDILSNTSFFIEMFGKLKTEVDKAIQEMGMNNWRDVLTKAADYYKSFSKYADNADYYLGQINDWADIAKAVVNWVKNQGFKYDVNGNITDLGNFQKAIDTAKATWDFFGLDKTNGYTKELPMTLAQMATSLENAEYMDFNSKDHVHNWDLVLADGSDTPKCIEKNIYEWKCSICGDTMAKVLGKENEKEKYQVTKPATGHVIDWTYYKDGANAAGDEVHYYAATCITPARVEGYCVNCKQPVGEWTTYGAPTGNHVYVLDNGTQADGKPLPGFTDKCTSVHSFVYHCETCGGAYTVTKDTVTNPDPENPGKTTPHDYYSKVIPNPNGNGTIATGEPLSEEEKLDLFNAWAQKNWNQVVYPEGEKPTEYKPFEKYETAVKYLYPQQQYEALKDNLNIVYQSEKTCVDPSLIVIECVECGVRYAYSFGEPAGHKLQLLIDEKKVTCTTDGLTPVYYCSVCNYYFQFKSGDAFVPKDGVNGVLAADGTTQEPYKFSTDYLLNNAGIVIHGIAQDADGNHTSAYWDAYYKCAELAYGHTFTAYTHNIASTCTVAGRSFQVCTTCGLLKKDDKIQGLDPAQGNVTTASLVGGHLIADPNYEKTEGVAYTTDDLDAIFNGTAENEGAFKTEGTETKTTVYPDFVKNLMDLTFEEAVAKLTERGYFTFVSLDPALKSVEELINKYITGLNISAIQMSGVDGHKFVPVYTNISNCVTAQQYTLVCEKCYKEDDKTLAELCAEKESGWVFVDGVYYAPEYTQVENSYDVVEAHEFTPTDDPENSLLASQWNAFWNEDALADGVAIEDVVNWLWTKKYFTRDLADDETVDSLYFAALELGDDLETLKAFYTGNNVIEGLKLPVAGHTFTSQVTTVVGNCVMYERTVWFCSICGQETVDPTLATAPEDTEVYSYSPDSDYYIGAHHTGSDYVATTDLTATWWAEYEAADGNVDVMLAWLAQYGYLNNRLPDGMISTPANRLVITEDMKSEQWYVNAKAALKDALENHGPNIADDLVAFFSGTNQLAEYTVKVDEKGNPITLGHTFAAVKIKAANCEGDGYYVYVCTKCGEVDDPLGKLSYTIGDKDYETDIDETVEFTPVNDDAQIITCTTSADKYVSTDLALAFADVAAGVEEGPDKDAKVMEAQLDWLYDHGYLNTVRDTWMKVGTAEYSKGGKVPDKGTVIGKVNAILTAYLEAHEDAGKLTELVASLFTAKNETSNSIIPTTVPAMRHLYAKEDGTLLKAADPQCTEYRSEVLTGFFMKGYTAEWDESTKTWKQGPAYDTKLFDAAKYPLNNKWFENAQKYGILAACQRESCPQQETVYTPERDGTYTAGYKAATDHQMHYYKFKPYGGVDAMENAAPGIEWVGTPSNVLEDPETPYNMKLPTDYVGEKWDLGDGEVEITEDNAKKAQLADEHNLYTMQRIYNTLHLPAADDPVWTRTPVAGADPVESRDSYKFYPEDGPLYAKITAGLLEQDWQPLTRNDKPSCWISLRCEWASTEGPCKKIEAKNEHTYPKTSDWNFSLNEANCQHGDRCIICQYSGMSSVTGHNLMNVKLLSGAHLEAWEKLYAEYAEAHDISYTWEEYFAPTCSEFGKDVYICTGELEKYAAYKAGNLQGYPDDKAFADENWIEQSSPDDPNGTYRVDDVDTTPHDYVTHYFVATGANRHQELSEEEWNNGFNHNLCLYGYYTMDICQNCKRDGKTVCGHVRYNVAPVNEDWQTKEGWKEFYTPQQLVFMEEQLKRTNADVQKTLDGLQARIEELLAKQSSSRLTEAEQKELTSDQNTKAMYERLFLKVYPAAIPEMDPKAVSLWNIQALIDALDKYEALEDSAAATSENAKAALAKMTTEELTAFVAKLTDSELNAIIGSGAFGSMSPFNDPARATDGKNGGAISVYVPAQNHVLAPVVGYKDRETYEGPTTDKNAVISQVCVICGFTTQEEYGATEVYSSDGKLRNQYKVATDAQIKAWNAHLDATENPKGYDYACGIDTSDLKFGHKEGDESVDHSNKEQAWKEAFPTGHYNYDTETTLNFDATPEQENFAGVDMNGSSTVDVKEKLTMGSKDSKNVEKRLDVSGNVTFRGKKEGEKAELDMSGFSHIQLTNGGTITFENLKVDLGDSKLYANKGKVVFKNCEVTGTSVLFTTNAETYGVWSFFESENSTFKTTDDVAVMTNKYSAEIKATNSTFEAARIAVAIRIGNGNFDGCTFKAGTKVAPEWGNGTDIAANAGLEIGNPIDGYAKYYADEEKKILQPRFATVTLTGDNKFEGEATDSIAIFSCENCKSTVTIDSTTKKNIKKFENDDVNVDLTYLVAANLSTEEVAALVTSVATEGGTIVLPENGKTAFEGQLNVGASADVTIDLSQGQLTLGKGVNTNGGKLTITNGNLVISDQHSGNVGMFVYGAGSELTLDKVNVYADAKVPTLLCPCEGKLTISDSMIYTNGGELIGMNANTGTSVEIVAIDSAFVADVAVDPEQTYGTFGLLLNNKNAEFFAGGCTFYGPNGAVWVRGGKAHFAGCTFISGNQSIGEAATWNQGTQLPNNALAALVVGYGAYSNAYGTPVNVELIDCTTQTVAPQAGMQMQAQQNGKEHDHYTFNGTLGQDEETQCNAWTVGAVAKASAEGAKGMVIALGYAETEVNVTFSDEVTATAFFQDAEGKLKNPVIGEDILLSERVTTAKLTIKYTATVGEKEQEMTLLPEKKATDASAAADVLAAAQNGGKVTFDETVTEVKPAAGLSVPAGKEVDIELTDKQSLNLEANDIKVAGGSSLTISGGKLTSAGNASDGGNTLFNVTGNEGSVTLKDVELTTTEAYGVGVAPDVTDATVTISGAKIASKTTAISVNGRSTATLELKNSVFIGDGGWGAYFAGKATVTATNCVFFGSETAAEVVSGDLTFEACTFISGGDMSGTAANKEFPSGKSNMPGEYAGNLSIVAKAGYQQPVSVTLNGNTQWVSVETNKGQVCEFDKLFKTSTEEGKTDKLTIGGVEYYYDAAETKYQHVTVSIIAADYATAETARVTLTTDAANALSLVVNTNVWIFTANTETDKNKVAEPDFECVKKLLVFGENNTSTLADQAKA